APISEEKIFVGEAEIVADADGHARLAARPNRARIVALIAALAAHFETYDHVACTGRNQPRRRRALADAARCLSLAACPSVLHEFWITLKLRQQIVEGAFSRSRTAGRGKNADAERSAKQCAPIHDPLRFTSREWITAQSACG